MRRSTTATGSTSGARCTLESFWALVRRGYNGTFHHIEPKHLHRYVNEFAGRLSDRAASAVEKMCNIVRARGSPLVTVRRDVTAARRSRQGMRAGGISRRADGWARRQIRELLVGRGRPDAADVRYGGKFTIPDSTTSRLIIWGDCKRSPEFHARAAGR